MTGLNFNIDDDALLKAYKLSSISATYCTLTHWDFNVLKTTNFHPAGGD